MGLGVTNCIGIVQKPYTQGFSSTRILSYQTRFSPSVDGHFRFHSVSYATKSLDENSTTSLVVFFHSFLMRSCTTTLTAQAWAGPTSIPRGAV